MNEAIKPITKNQLKDYGHYLSSNEKMIFFTGLSHLYLVRRLALKFIFPGIIFIVVITVGGYLAGVELLFALLAGYGAALIFAMVSNYFLRKGTQYILTDRRMIMQQGFFNISLTSAAYDKITHVEVKQGFIERTIYKYGTIVVHTAGSSNKEIVIKNIAYPLQFKNMLEKLIDDAQRRPRKKKSKPEVTQLRRIRPK